ncbi:MAG: MBL fold metallo-hydrolase [Saprospiraceae bacterium]|nr:MBL fold metallo-hydrolase [Saprospiraceae bacterium]
MTISQNDPVWHVKFYGVRGSTPVCDPGFQRFGGNTTCIYVDLLTNDRSKLIGIIDAGTGIRKLGKEIMKGTIPKTDHIMLAMTHFHWDHIQGLPFFDPAYEPDTKIAIFSPHHQMQKDELRGIFERHMQEDYFPVQLSAMGSEIRFFTEEEYSSYLSFERSIEFTHRMHNHPGGACSYRLSANGKSLVVCTDLEHGEELDPEVVAFCKDADLLIHDAQYTDEELPSHRGWGHSSYSQAIACAEQAGAKQLVLTHHDPNHDDDFLEHMETQCKLRFPRCVMAREGMEIMV